MPPRPPARPRYFKTFLSRGKRFNYLRPPDGPQIRLSDDLDEALQQARDAMVRSSFARRVDRQVTQHARVMLANAKRRQRATGLPMELTLADIEEMLRLQEWRCAVSGIRFELTPQPDRFYAPWRPSLDRIDNARGYVPGNVRIVCVIANWAMGEWGEAALLRLARAVIRKAERERRLDTPNGAGTG